MKKLIKGSLCLALISSCGAPTPAEQLCLSALESQLTVCPGATTVPGIDVSYYQGTINWASVKASGQKFAITRVSDGANFADSKFITNWQAIKAQGLVRGTYQFFRPGQDPLTQANFLLARVAAAGGFAPNDLPVVMDMETADGQTPATIQARMHVWLNRIEAATGKRPIIYTANFMSSNIGTGFSSYVLWVANYGAACPLMPTGWAQWKVWQYASTGSISGISGNVDVNKWNGTLAQLIAYVTPPPPPPPPPVDAGRAVDAGHADAGHADAGHADAGHADAGHADAGTPADAGTRPDAGAVVPDAGPDEPDAGVDPALDGGEPPPSPDGGEGEVLGSGRLEFIQTCGP